MSGLLPLCYIGEVREGQVAWKAKVIVLTKSNIVRLKSSGRSVQKCLLEDAEGTPIEAIMWDDDIRKFQGTLEPLCTYMIQGAELLKIEDLSSSSRDRKLEWKMIGRTVVEPVVSEAEMLPYPALDFTEIAVLQTFSPYTDVFDVIGVVAYVENAQKVKQGNRVTWIRNVWVTDQSLALMPITLSDEFLDNQGLQIAGNKKCMPIIVCWNLSISASTGFPCINMASYISIDPAIPEVHSLRTWVSVNLNRIQALRPTMKPKRQAMGTPTNHQSTITDAGKSDNGEPKYGISGTLRIPDLYEPIAFL